MQKNVKKRHWAFIVYPESAPADWKEILEKSGVAFCVSPLHDKDVNPDGTSKKAHYHVIVSYSGPTTYSVVLSLTDELCCPRPQPLEAVKGYYRYLTHMDNPEKYQYSKEDIYLGNGFDPCDYMQPSKTEIDRIRIELTKLCIEADITEYAELIDLLLDSQDDRLTVAMSSSIFFTSYLKSRRFMQKGVPHND